MSFYFDQHNSQQSLSLTRLIVISSLHWSVYLFIYFIIPCF